MRTAVVALGLLATLVPFVCGNSFKEFSDTDAACEFTPFKEHIRSELENDGCIAVDEGTVSIISHSNYWSDIGHLYGYDTADCSSQTLGKLPTKKSECWPVDDFNGQGWGRVVRGVKLEVID